MNDKPQTIFGFPVTVDETISVGGLMFGRPLCDKALEYGDFKLVAVPIEGDKVELTVTQEVKIHRHIKAVG